jgi:tRNA nucleotidyltransferase (CCA-adding enzyme)
MAYHPEKGLVDGYSGMADLSAGRICCVGDPDRRFSEDALRILRALRFSAVLGFSVEKVTADTIHRLAPLLHRISPERIAAELQKLLAGQDVRRVMMEFADVFGVVLPPLQPMIGLRQDNPYHHLTVYEHTVETVAAVRIDPVLRLTMLFHDCGKPACYTRDEQGIDHFRGHPAISAALAEQAMEQLRMDRRTIDAVKQLILHHDDTISLTDRCLKRLLNRLGSQAAHQLVEVQRADVRGQHPDKRDRLEFLDAVEARLTELEAENACYRLSDLKISGDDLIQIGYKPGRALGDTLQQLLDEVIDGTCPNDRAVLLKRAEERK